MANSKKKIFRPIQIIIPIIIGLIVVGWLFADDIKNFDISTINISFYSAIALLIVLITIAGREFGYMWRYRILSNKDLGWLQTFKITMLCEFSSTITPSSVGGSSLAMIFMSREGIKAGRGTGIVLITLFLDELFFVLSCPLVFVFVPANELFGTLSFSSGLKWTFWIVYTVIAVWTAILYVGIFYKPHYIKNLLLFIFRIKILQRWRHGVEDFGNSFIEVSKDAAGNSYKWWLKCFGATSISWISRYLLVNALFFGMVEAAPQVLVFARQAVVWLLLIVTPTPGGSGVSEWLFTKYYSDMLPSASVALMIALVWRVFTYYTYLFIGVIIVPTWLSKKKKRNKKHEKNI